MGSRKTQEFILFIQKFTRHYEQNSNDRLSQVRNSTHLKLAGYELLSTFDIQGTLLRQRPPKSRVCVFRAGFLSQKSQDKLQKLPFVLTTPALSWTEN